MGFVKKAISFLRGDASAYQNLLKGSLISLVLRITGQAINYGLVLTISRLFGAAGYGAYSLFQAVLQFFTQSARLGFDVLMMRESARSHSENELGALRSEYHAAVRLTAVTSLLLGILLFVFASTIARDYFNKPHLTFYFKIAAFCILPLVHINIYASYLKGKKHFREFNFIQQISLLLFTLIFILSVFWIYRNPEVVAVAYAIACLITLMLAFIWYRKFFQAQMVKVSVSWSSLISVSLTFFVVGLMSYLRNATEAVILGRFFSEESVGIFKASQKVSSIISFTLFSTIVAAAPHFAELFKQQKLDELRHTVQKTTTLIFWTSLPIFLVLILFPGFILHLFGKEFSSGKEAMWLMCMGQFFNSTMGPANNLLLMINKQRIVLYISVFNNIVCALLGWHFIPQYGINGAAILSLLGILIPNIAAVSIIRWQFGFFTFNYKMLNQIFKR